MLGKEVQDRYEGKKRGGEKLLGRRVRDGVEGKRKQERKGDLRGGNA